MLCVLVALLEWHSCPQGRLGKKEKSQNRLISTFLMTPSTEDLMSPMRPLPTVPHRCSGTRFLQHHGLQPCASFTLYVSCGDQSMWKGPSFSSFPFELQLFHKLDMSGTALPLIPTYAGDLRSLLGWKSQQGRAGSSLGRDLHHLNERG